MYTRTHTSVSIFTDVPSRKQTLTTFLLAEMELLLLLTILSYLLYPVNRTFQIMLQYLGFLNEALSSYDTGHSVLI